LAEIGEFTNFAKIEGENL